METNFKQSYIDEIEYQTTMLNNLKRWLRNSIIFSSISLVLILLGPSLHPYLKIVGFVLMIISLIACLLISLGLKNGRDNIYKILNYIKK